MQNKIGIIVFEFKKLKLIRNKMCYLIDSYACDVGLDSLYNVIILFKLQMK